MGAVSAPSRRRSRTVGVLFGACIAVSACSALDNLTGGGHDEPSDDLHGSGQGSDGDGGGNDGASSEDATPAPTSSDGGFCELADATFCDDFDTIDLAVAWESRYQRGGATIDHDRSDAAASPPNTLLLDVPPSTASTDPANRNAYVSRHFDGSYTHFELSFWLLVEANDTENNYGAMQPFMIRVPDPNNPNAYHSITLYLYANRAYPYEQDTLPDGGQTNQQLGNLFVSPTAGKPTRFSIAIDLNPDGGRSTLTVTEDGTVQGHYTGSLGLLPGWTLGPKVLIAIGDIYNYGSNTAWRLRYDDLTVVAR